MHLGATGRGPAETRENLLLVMAKAPRPGAVKTRLCPPLTPALAADLYRAFLRDTLALGASLPGVALGVVYPPTPDDWALRALLPSGTLLWPQAGVGLGDGLHGAFARAFAGQYRRVVVVSSDSPTLPPAIVAEAFAALDSYDVVLGPTVDGGYYLIGLAAPRPRLFEDITWSTAAVYAQTLARAAERGCRVHATAVWHDVDNADDLMVLAEQGAHGAAPHTAAVLDSAAMRAVLRELGGLTPIVTSC